MTCFSIPKDYERYPECRKLFAYVKSRCGSPYLITNFLFVKLWVELSYQATRAPLGTIHKDDLKLWVETALVKDEWCKPDNVASMLVGSRMLKDQGEAYFCQMFYTFNEELSRDFRLPQAKASDMVRLKRLRTRYEKAADKNAHDIPAECFTTVDDQKITATEMNRVTVLVRLLDGILYQNERANHEFGVGLIQDGCRVVRKYSPRKVEMVLNRLMARRRDPDIPRSAEKILAYWDDIMVQIAPDRGWANWVKVANHREDWEKPREGDEAEETPM